MRFFDVATSSSNDNVGSLEKPQNRGKFDNSSARFFFYDEAADPVTRMEILKRHRLIDFLHQKRHHHHHHYERRQD